eukprot:jgi/Chlat1/6154/Chrsp41S05699
MATCLDSVHNVVFGPNHTLHAQCQAEAFASRRASDGGAGGGRSIAPQVAVSFLSMADSANTKRFEGKVFLVTGASSVGAVTAEHLAAQGAHVWVTACRKDLLEPGA